ncbi:penicillin-binding protein 2 [Verrucomicrobiaceae bacterium N1E253]|uniref:Penicillin-binding protein 2 n=1 Tax=Oceaniferula marina TaxID=2748318 RepID=A0A851GMC6_9BACT|nr:penicillin-binding protein 2 [Oceaniferula marina]NWK56295.1 penicillin-binding protein 2 [Oceaniferula marina]
MNLKSFRRRCLFLCLTFVVGLSALSARLIYLQVIKADDYAKMSDRVSIRKEILRANRGCIVDTNNQLIARNIPRALMALDKKLLMDTGPASLSLANLELRGSDEWNEWDARARDRNIRSRASRLKDEMPAEDIVQQHIEHVISTFARPLGMTREELRLCMQLDQEKKKYVVIKKDLSEDEAYKLKQLGREHSIVHAFHYEESQKRWYVMPEMASHIIGYTDHQSEGKAGIESRMNRYMAGHDGYVKNHRDKFDLLAVAKPQEISPPRHGLNIQLTLDMGLQAILEEELEAGLREFYAEKGSIVLMNPHTGEVLAMASYPSYNLNTREDVVKNGFDFATQAIYEPGSTFKVIAAAGALDKGLVSPQTEIFCHYGLYRNGSVRVPDHHPYGNLTVEQVLAKSSNPGAYKLALLLGRKNYYDYVSAFGFGKKTNIAMAGESAGVVRNTGNPTDFSRVSYGYAVSVTPLQVACAYSAIANGGRLMRPLLVKSIMANDGTVVMNYKPEPVRRVLKERTAMQMLKALATVVDIKGTAKRAKVEGYQVAGKTGTSKKLDFKNGGYLDGRYTVSFAGMMPAEKPAFVCVVVVDDPQTTEVKRYGGTIAAPIFAKVAKRVANRMGLKPTEPIEPKETTEPLAQTHH